MTTNKNLTAEELEVLVEHKFQNDMNVIQHSYVDIAGDLVAGALLRQIMYWFSPGEDGKQRVRVQKEGFYWLAKSRNDWYEEIRITAKQYDRAAKLLVSKGLIICTKYKFDGAPMVHLRPNYDVLNSAIQEWKEDAKREILESGKSILPKGKKRVNTMILPNEENGKTAETLDFPQTSKSELPKGKNGTSPKVKMEINERVNSLTENLTEITTKSTNRELQQQRDKESAQNKKTVVVELQELLFDSFKQKISNQEAAMLFAEATNHHKSIDDVVSETKKHFEGKAIKNLVGVLLHCIRAGWNKPIQATVAKPLPVVLRTEEQQEVDDAETDVQALKEFYEKYKQEKEKFLSSKN